MGGGGGGLGSIIAPVQNFLKDPVGMITHPSIEGIMKMDPLANLAGLNDPSPQLPGVGAAPPVPGVEDTMKAAGAEVTKARRGKASTYLTGASGLALDPTSNKRTLLGS